jgi:lipopolysaccharide transport system permease protein
MKKEHTGSAKTYPIAVYEPDSRRNIGFLKIWMIMLTNMMRSRELVFVLFKRDFFAGYRKSFLGITWIFISPVLGIVSWVFMNATGILNPGDVGIPYPAYILIGSSVWGLFMGFYGAAEGTLGAGGGFIMQIKYPHEALLIKQIGLHLANFSIGFILNIAILLVFGVVPSWKIIFFPVLILPLLFLGTGLGLVISVISVVAGEIRTVIGMGLGFLIYITPVIYSSNFDNPLLQSLIKWNPLTYLITAVRDSIIYGRIDHFDRFILSSALAFAIFLFSWKLFYVSEEKVIEKMI